MCVADEPFLGEIVQPDLAGAGETMRPVRGNTHSEAIKFFKEPKQSQNNYDIREIQCRQRRHAAD